MHGRQRQQQADGIAAHHAVDLGACAGIGVTLAGAPSNGRPGCLRKASPAPSNNRQIEPATGKVQLPVRSIKYPNTEREIIPPTPNPKLLMTLATPQSLAPLSI